MAGMGVADAEDDEGAMTTGVGLETGGRLCEVDVELTEPVVAQPDKTANALRERSKVCFIENCFSIHAMRQSVAHRQLLGGESSKPLFGARVGGYVKKG